MVVRMVAPAVRLRRRTRTRRGVAWLGFHFTRAHKPHTKEGTNVDIRVELTGVTPLLCHNIALADPDNPIVVEIKTFTDKRKKTEDDRRAIERLEWFGGLYVDDGRPVLPTGNIRKAFIQAGKISKQGLMVSRALNFTSLTVPIAHSGPDTVEALHKDSAFTNRSAVGISGKRTMRVRPQFPAWAIVANALLLDDVMDVADLVRVAERAGAAEGLGDNRGNGYGRFTVRVVRV